MASEQTEKSESKVPTQETLLQFWLGPIRRRGLGGFLRHLKSIGVRQVWVRYSRALIDWVDRRYDRLHNVDTSGWIWSDEIQTESANRRYGHEYVPTPAKTLRRMLDAVPVGPNGYSFVDYGSGKGRAILVAAERPFSQIVGVEYSGDLVHIANRNLASYRHGDHQCKKIQVVHIDATLFEPPTGPCLFFLFSPFTTQVLQPVLKRIERSNQEDPRPMVVLYCEHENSLPIPMQLFEDIGFLSHIETPSLPRDLTSRKRLIYSIFLSEEVRLPSIV